MPPDSPATGKAASDSPAAGKAASDSPAAGKAASDSSAAGKTVAAAGFPAKRLVRILKGCLALPDSPAAGKTVAAAGFPAKRLIRILKGCLALPDSPAAGKAVAPAGAPRKKPLRILKGCLALPDSPAAGNAVAPAGAPRKKPLRILKGCFALAVVVFWVLLIQRNWNALAATPWSLDAPWAIAALLAFVLYFLGQGAGWVMIARAMGYRIPLVGGTGVWLLSMPARYVPGNVWHIAARITLAAGLQMAPEGVVVSSAAEQLLMVLSAACLGLAWLPSWAGVTMAPWLPSWAAIGGAPWLPSWAGFGGAPWALAFLLACLAGLQPPVLRFLLRLGSRLLGRTMPALNLGYRQMIFLLILYSFVNLINGLAFALLAAAAAQSPPALWPTFVSAYCLAYVVGYLSFLTPSGIGVREAALASMLGLYLPVPSAIALTLLARLLSTAGEAAAVLAVGLPAAGGVRRS